MGFASRSRVADGVRRAHWNVIRFGGGLGPGDARGIAPIHVAVNGDAGPLSERLLHPGHVRRIVDQREEPLALLEHLFDRQPGVHVPRKERTVDHPPLFLTLRLPLPVPLVAVREDAAKVRVPLMVLDEDRQGRERRPPRRGDLSSFSALPDREFAAEEDADARALSFFVGADDAVEAVAVGDAERVVAQLRGALDEALGRRRGLQEGEVRARSQLDVRHLNIVAGVVAPCR